MAAPVLLNRSPPSGPRLPVQEAQPLIKYTVGPEFSGYEYRLISEALEAIVADGNGGVPVLVQVYPGTYTEDVVIPEELTKIVIQGWGINRQRSSGVIRVPGGTIIDGSLTVNLADGGTFTEFDSITVSGVTTITQASPPTPNPSNVMVNTVNCTFGGGFNLTSDRVAGGIEFSSLDSHFIGLQTVSCRNVWMTGGSAQGGVLQVGSISFMRGVRLEGSPSNVLYILHADASFFGLYNCLEIWGRITFTGNSCVMHGCIQNHNGSPAVQDDTTGSSYCQGNTFTHNAGPAGPVWVKSGTGIFHDGGNNFTEGQQYPWYSVPIGTIQDPAESDIQLRRTLEVSGSPSLTPAQIGAQRKTTVLKTDGGGAVTLPSVADVEPGCTVIVKDLNANATGSPFTVVPDGAETIDGAASYSISTDFAAVEIQSNGADWSVIGAYL